MLCGQFFIPPSALLTDFALIWQDWISVRVELGCREGIFDPAPDQLRRRIPDRLHLLHERHYPLELNRLGLIRLIRLANLN